MRTLKLTLWAVTICGCLIFASKATADEPDMQVNVIIESAEQYGELFELHPYILEIHEGYAVILTDNEQLAELSAMGFSTEIIRESVSDWCLERLAMNPELGVGSMGGYRTLSEIYEELDLLHNTYCQIIGQRQAIGLTIEGKPIYAVNISNSPTFDEEEPEILYAAAIHANEVITPEVLIHYMNYLGLNYGYDQQVTQLVDNREMWFVVVMNPDGYYYNEITDPDGCGMWRTNRRDNGDETYGVDLNRNYGYRWGFDNMGSAPGTDPPCDCYRGEYEFSEPETQAIRDFIEDHNFAITANFHAYGNYFIYPWDYMLRRTSDHEIFLALGDSVSHLSGYVYESGSCIENLKYRANGTSDDWGYGDISTKNRNMAITIEIGTEDDKFWPATDRILPLVQQNIEPCLFLARIAGDISDLKCPDKAVIDAPTSSDGVEYTVEWQNVYNAEYYELVEMQNSLLSEDALDNDNNWITKNFRLDDNIVRSGSYSLMADDSTGFNYIQTKIPVTVTPGLNLTFWLQYHQTCNAYMGVNYTCVEVSTDGKEFYSIPGNITTERIEDDLDGYSVHAIDLQQPGWVQGVFDLSNYVGQDILIRISYYCYSFCGTNIFYVDDIYPVQTYDEPVNVIASDLTETSYTFYGKSVGEYYYKVRAIDAQGQKGIFSDAKKTIVYGSYICGDVNYDQEVDQGDINYLMAYIFQGGPEPIPLESGEVNCDGNVNVGDVVYLVNYIYHGGPAPCDCNKNLIENIAEADNGIVLYPELHGDGIVYTLSTSEELSGVQLSLPIDASNSGIVLLDNRFRIYENAANGITNLCFVIDGNGTKPIGPGKYPIFSVSEKVRMTEALAVKSTSRTVGIAFEDIQYDEIVRNDLQPSLKSFPNPFNATTQISFTLSQRSHVSLEIFNILGQKVVTLADEHFEAGTHSVTWDASNVASGIYLYRIKAGDFVESKTMTLLK